MNTKQIKRFVTAGNATFTITSARTGRHMTYQCNKPLGEEGNGGAPIFVKVLTGPDNRHDYTYLGMLAPSEEFIRTKKSANMPEHYRAFRWFWEILRAGRDLPDTVIFQHAGRCGRCGRTLTTPESIELGLGPVCAEKEGRS